MLYKEKASSKCKEGEREGGKGGGRGGGSMEKE